jgi:hypothetical protein
VWVSDYWKDIDDTQVGLAEQFTTDLEKTLAKKANKVSFDEDWPLTLASRQSAIFGTKTTIILTSSDSGTGNYSTRLLTSTQL